MLTAGLLVLSLIAAILLPLLLPSGEAVTLEMGGEVIGNYPLDTDRQVTVESENGYNLVVIKGGRVYVEEADCRCGVCTAHTPIDKEGETIICLPHKLIVRIVWG